jgi:hypothetical protein
MRTMGLRELRRRQIGQHTIEKALCSTVRIKSYRGILAAIEAYKAERAVPSVNRDHANDMTRVARPHPAYGVPEIGFGIE